jgi:hypothetical protein
MRAGSLTYLRFVYLTGGDRGPGDAVLPSPNGDKIAWDGILRLPTQRQYPILRRPSCFGFLSCFAAAEFDKTDSQISRGSVPKIVARYTSSPSARRSAAVDQTAPAVPPDAAPKIRTGSEIGLIPAASIRKPTSSTNFFCIWREENKPTQ